MKISPPRMLVYCLGLILSFLSLPLQAQDYTIYPVPQKMATGTQSVSLTTNVNVVAETGTDETILARMKEVLEQAGYTYTLTSSLSAQETNLLIGTGGSGLTADAYAREHQISQDVLTPADNHFDPHLLDVNARHPHGDILILGNTEGSAYYAFATLEQLLEQAEEQTLRTVNIEDYAFVKMRGIVEGFYGHTYSIANRLDLLDYCKRYKMNTYFYGPKSDPYHTGLWRDEYPTQVSEAQRFMGLITQDDLRTLASKAKACHVDFVWSIHPALQGGGIDFYNLDPGVAEIMTKFQHMYDLGIRHFGVSVDDMSGHPNTQHELADKVQRQLLEKYNGPATAPADRVGPLLFVPTQYALNFGTHTLPAFQSVYKDIEIVFTGDNVFSHIKAYSFQMMKDLIGRNPVMWWNNPVNDDHDDYLYLHGLTARWNIETPGPIPTMKGLILNPMNQAQASKICLFGAADYAWNPAQFNSASNWEASLRSIFKEAELQEALKNFIRAMSSYAQWENGEEYMPLYEDFEYDFSTEQIPEATGLLAAMDRTWEACVRLQTLADSENEIYRLFYADIAPWLHKVQSMADLVRRSIRLMEKPADLDNWTAYSQLLSDMGRLHKDSKYFLSVLEGSGTDTYETFREAQPTPNGLNSFVTFLSEQITGFIPELPARNKDCEIITNQEETTAGLDLTDGLSLTGLNGLTLSPGDYVGVNMKAIRPAAAEALPDAVQQALTTEWSINGKDWTAFVPDGQTRQNMVYLRLKNKKELPYVLPISSLHIGLDRIDYYRPSSVRSNLTQYQNYVIDYVIDGNPETKFWSNRAQRSGDFIEIDYGTELAFFDIELLFSQNDQPSGTTAVQVSRDAKNWETVSRFRPTDIREGRYTCNAQGRYGRYVRMLIEQTDRDLWLQVQEIKAKGSGFIAVAQDEKGNGISLLDDGKLTEGYQAESAGSVTYRFIENLNIDEVRIFHNSVLDETGPLPQISVLDSDKWTAVGELDAPCTVIPMQDFTHPAQLKITWNAQNIPALYEIQVTGTPYQEGVQTGITEIRPSTGISLQTEGLKLSVRAAQPLTEIILLDMEGKVHTICHPDGTHSLLTLPASGLWLVQTVTQDGKTEVHKIAVP